MPSNKIAHRHEERNFRPEIVPNPFGGQPLPLGKRGLRRRYCPQPTPFYTLSKTARRPENPEAVWRCLRKAQDEEDVFSEESNSVLALVQLHGGFEFQVQRVNDDAVV